MQSDQPRANQLIATGLDDVLINDDDRLVEDIKDLAIIDDSSLEDISDETRMKMHSIEEAKEKKVRKKYNEKDYEKIGTISSEFAKIKIKKINGTYKIV
jgi:hypothetical protein